jgi:hypothetical protein
MTTHQEQDIPSLAYELAWQQFLEIPFLTADEKMAGPDKLRAYVRIMIDACERNPLKIARSALGMLRQEEQVIRSRARVTDQRLSSAA